MLPSLMACTAAMSKLRYCMDNGIVVVVAVVELLLSSGRGRIIRILDDDDDDEGDLYVPVLTDVNRDCR